MFRRYIEATAGTGAITLALILALSTAASGAVIPTADLEFWVRADAGVTKDGSNYVTSWADQTPSSTEFAGPDGTQPLWVSGALGGKPVIRFDGNDRLWNNRFATANPIQGNEITAFMVANRSAVSVNTSAATFIQNGQARDYNNTPSFVMAYEGTGGTTLQTYRNSGLSTASHPGNASPYIFATTFDGANNTAFLNGAPQGAVAGSGAFDVDHIVIGQRYDLGFSNGYVGDIAELIVYDRALSAAERNQVGAYLSDKYGIGGVYNPGMRNGQFEDVVGGGTYPQAAEWDGACQTALHAAFPYGNNGPLGDRFAFTLPSNADASQTIGTPFAPDTTYVFNGFGVDNNVNNENDIAFRIGYLDGSNVFQELASETYDLTGLTSWTELDGVTYMTGASGPELGQLITLRIGAINVDYVNGGVFFDHVALTTEATSAEIPEPLTLTLLGLSTMALGRYTRRRR